MAFNENDPEWNEEDGDDELGRGEILPPDDRIWMHPSEISFLHLTSKRQSKLSRFKDRLYRFPISSVIVLLLVGIVLGASAQYGLTSMASASPKVPKPTSNTYSSVVLPSELSKKISIEALAVTTIKTSSGSFWEAATFVNSSHYLVTSAAALKTNEKLLVKGKGNKWSMLSVTALDPLTNSAVLQSTNSSPNFIPPYSKDLPPVGALEELISPQQKGAKNKVITAEVKATSTPLTLSKSIYIPNSIELTTQSQNVTLGSLVLDPEGDPVGIVVTTKKIKRQVIIYATPMPSLIRITTMVAEHKAVSHGYLGVSGLTTNNPAPKSSGSAVKVTSIAPNSPAQLAHIAIGSYITSLNGLAITSLPQLQGILESTTPGTKVKLGLYMGSKRETITITVGKHP
ncbi:PDZ domain-containing protein [Acidithrix ferrooxidans]|uniref:Putative serine protease HtrA n=1 Tax=Acidithrix ferrooxidans TaxID=1280514 RepID=A0A0D8HDH0_9ACTN|nr:PDZ domain-containing protein [Acidithrix ferrooxidans]KJF16005.1 putative serine protease HtrA [Acidithrix ferrooxidans]